jgi:hypothetical protein
VLDPAPAPQKGQGYRRPLRSPCPPLPNDQNASNSLILRGSLRASPVGHFRLCRFPAKLPTTKRMSFLMNEDRLLQLLRFVREANEAPESAKSVAAGQRLVSGCGTLDQLLAARRSDRLNWEREGPPMPSTSLAAGGASSMHRRRPKCGLAGA